MTDIIDLGDFRRFLHLRARLLMAAECDPRAPVANRAITGLEPRFRTPALRRSAARDYRAYRFVCQRILASIPWLRPSVAGKPGREAPAAARAMAAAKVAGSTAGGSLTASFPSFAAARRHALERAARHHLAAVVRRGADGWVVCTPDQRPSDFSSSTHSWSTQRRTRMNGKSANVAAALAAADQARQSDLMDAAQWQHEMLERQIDEDAAEWQAQEDASAEVHAEIAAECAAAMEDFARLEEDGWYYGDDAPGDEFGAGDAYDDGLE